MSENKKYYWLKLPKDFFEDRAIKKLRSIDGGDTYTIIYLKMLLRTLEDGGKFVYEGIEDSIVEEIALDIDEKEEDVSVAVNYLIKKGLMICTDNEAELTRMHEMVGSESNSKNRVSLCRERKKVREQIPLKMVKKLSNEQLCFPDGNIKFIDNKRYGGNAEYVYELAQCKCEYCGETNTKKLLIHHNNGYSNDLEDLYVLCQKCHANVENGNITDLKHNRISVTCNTNVTDCNSVETESNTEKEKEIDKEIDKEISSNEDIKKCSEQDVKENDNESPEVAKPKAKKPKKNKYGDYSHVLLTEEEYLKLHKDYPNADEIIQYLDSYIEEKGYKANSHYLSIKRWVVNAVKEDNRRSKGNRYTHTKSLPPYMNDNGEVNIPPKEEASDEDKQKAIDELNSLMKVLNEN